MAPHTQALYQPHQLQEYNLNFMFDRVIFLVCILLLLSGFIFGKASIETFNIIETLTTWGTIIGGFSTAVALYWAINTYEDWKKTKTLNEYNAIIELGKCSKSLLLGSYYLLDTMSVFKHQYDEFSEVERSVRSRKINHAVSIFEKNIERYNDERSVIEFLDKKVCEDNLYKRLDMAVDCISELFWLLRTEKLESTMVPDGTIAAGVPVFPGIIIPEFSYKKFQKYNLEKKYLCKWIS